MGRERLRLRVEGKRERSLTGCTKRTERAVVDRVCADKKKVADRVEVESLTLQVGSRASRCKP